MTDVIVQIFVGAAALGGLVLCYVVVLMGKEARYSGRGTESSASRPGR